MGEVWRARHQPPARPCAAKLVRRSPRRKPRCRRGAFPPGGPGDLALTSPNTVRLYDFGVSETGSLDFVMELLDGLDLLTLIQRFDPLPQRVLSRFFDRRAARWPRRTRPGRCTATSSRTTSSCAGSESTSTSSRSRLRSREVGGRGRRQPHRRRRPDRHARQHAAERVLGSPVARPSTSTPSPAWPSGCSPASRCFPGTRWPC